MVLAGWRRDIPAVLSCMDVCVLTSLWEGLPISILEAMAYAKPIVATNTGGIQEILEDGKDGFLFRPRRAQDMSEKVILLLKDAQLRQRLGVSAKSSLGSDFNPAKMADDTENLYAELMGHEEGGHVH